MKQQIAIIGSTGSIGTSLLSLIDPKDFTIVFLAANKNYKKLLSQAKRFNVKNLILTNMNSYNKAIKSNKNKKINFFNNFDFLNKIIKKKLDYVMSSFTGIDGLKPTYEIIKYTKKIAIANKESLICAWPLIKKELKINSTEFIPVDSEHFSIWSEIKNTKTKFIKKVYLTASGGPLLNYNHKFLNKVKLSTILKHPTWKMGKKISVDSATMMNKCFEVMEAKNIFNLKYNQIDILVHPSSYVHAIIEYKNGLSKLVLHDTSMKIPIFNTIYAKDKSHKVLRSLQINKLNEISFKKISTRKFPVTKILNKMPRKHSLFETVIVSINDCIVNNYLNKKAKFSNISRFILKSIDSNLYKQYKSIYPKNITEIIKLNNKIKYDFETFKKNFD